MESWRSGISGIARWWGGLSLRGKLMASILAPALVIISVLYAYSLQDMMANFDREYRDRALAVAQSLQQSITQEDLKDAPRLQAFLRGLASSNRTLYRTSIYVPRDGTALVLASSDPARVGQPAEPRDLESLRTGDTLFAEKRDEEIPLMEANVPLVIGGAPIAAVGVYMSLEPRDALVQSQQVKFLVIGGGGLLLLLALVYFLTERMIVEPVARVSEAASRIAQGDLGTKLPNLGQDEVGRLASSVGLMVEELLEDRRTLERLATTDGLTELWNHRYFYERLRAELNRAVRLGQPLSLVMLDLDHFKAFNDAHGHLKGDEALRKVALILRTSVRPYDVPCRYGGEEFTVIVPGVEATGARDVAERVRQRIYAQDFDGLGSQRIPLTASFGVSSYPQDGSDPVGLVRAADAALYAAKRSGGNVTRLYDQSVEVEVEEERVSIDRLFRKANLEALQAIARAADARDASTRGHSLAVTGYAMQLGAILGLAPDELEILETASLLHDIGKIGIPESILAKPGTLTEREWEVVRSHSIIGELMVKQVPSLSKTLAAVLHHHERWDGTGYPDGLRGEGIPLFARMLAIADAYEAMTAPRPYRRTLGKEEVLEEFRKGAGTQFDPRLVEIFLALTARGNQDADQEADSSVATLAGSPEAVVDVEADQHQAGGDDGEVEGAHDAT